MDKSISPKIVVLTFGVLMVCFAVAFYAVAWQEPAQAPPGGNVAAPLNVSNVGQIKTGNLVVNALGTTATSGNALIVNSGGNLCLGSDCRSTWPVAGGTPVSAGLYGACSQRWMVQYAGVSCLSAQPPASCSGNSCVCSSGYSSIQIATGNNQYRMVKNYWGEYDLQEVSYTIYYSCYKQ